jgi:hypothetical protein
MLGFPWAQGKEYWFKNRLPQRFQFARLLTFDPGLSRFLQAA